MLFPIVLNLFRLLLPKKPKAKSGKKKSKPQETPKKDFSFPAPRLPKGGTPYRGSGSRGRGGGPSKRGASAPKKH